MGSWARRQCTRAWSCVRDCSAGGQAACGCDVFGCLGLGLPVAVSVHSSAVTPTTDSMDSDSSYAAISSTTCFGWSSACIHHGNNDGGHVHDHVEAHSGHAHDGEDGYGCHTHDSHGGNACHKMVRKAMDTTCTTSTKTTS